MSLNKYAILASKDLPLQEVEVPEWGGTVFLRTFSVAEGILIEEAKEMKSDNQVVGLYLTYALGDAEGKRLFSETEIDDLYIKNPNVLMRLFHQAVAHNKSAEEDDAKREGKS